MAYKNLYKKYDVTKKELRAAIDQIKLGSIACDGVVLVALCDLLCSGDILVEVPNEPEVVYCNNYTTTP